jgi:hypothetical protein
MKKSAKPKSSTKQLVSKNKTVFSQNFAYAALVLLFACLLVVLYQDRQIKITVEAINTELMTQRR